MRTKRTVIVLISGKAGSGKTTVSRTLRDKLVDIPGMSIFSYSFANPLKYIAKSYMGWDGNKDEKGRVLLQELGRIGRDYDTDIWVKHLLQQMDKQAGLLPFNFTLVDDWRFPNELAYLEKNPVFDVVTVRVFGRGGLNGETAMDVSENSLPEATSEQAYYDFQIDNSGSLEQLEQKLDSVLASLEKQYIVE